MVAFGGAAPLHAARLCEKLGIDRLLVPPGAGVGSAIGFLRAPFGYEAVRSSFMRLSDFNPGKALDVLGEIAAETAEVAQAGDPEANPVFERRAHMRYAGQGWEIPVELPRRLLENLSPAALRLEFEKEYRRLYGRALPELDIEILSWTVTARIPAAARAQALPIDGVRSLKAASSRRAFDARLASYLDASVVERSCMRPGDEIAGPAAIVEAETTTVVTSAFLAAMQADGSLLLSRRRDDL